MFNSGQFIICIDAYERMLRNIWYKNEKTLF